ncbi:sugar nucleotide-binding protein [Desulfobacula sp.]|uniref:sugar nucleotide-binding protein n=1 Tax=Desulfobacula sp. TaxID=2593537 RepID=UPI003FA45DC5
MIPVTTAEYPTPAGRPLNSVMDCSMLINNFGISLIQWQKSLAAMLSQNPTPINQTTTTTQA